MTLFHYSNHNPLSLQQITVMLDDSELQTLLARASRGIPCPAFLYRSEGCSGQIMDKIWYRGLAFANGRIESQRPGSVCHAAKYGNIHLIVARARWADPSFHNAGRTWQPGSAR